MREEFRIKNLQQWEKKLKELFPDGMPKEMSWVGKESIISVLNKIGAVPSLNHLLFPSGGGLDLTGAKHSSENNCIELCFGDSVEIVKPISLTFNSFDADLEWAYFRLETEGLEPSGVYETKSDLSYEEVTELTPGHYVSYSVWEYGYYGYDENGNEKKLPSTARVISRSFGGAYLIIAKTCKYNQIPATYDGRHNRMTAERFRQEIAKVAKNSHEKS